MAALCQLKKGCQGACRADCVLMLLLPTGGDLPLCSRREVAEVSV